jgi:hypothetical protein
MVTEYYYANCANRNKANIRLLKSGVYTKRYTAHHKLVYPSDIEDYYKTSCISGVSFPKVDSSLFKKRYRRLYVIRILLDEGLINTIGGKNNVKGKTQR